MVAKLGACRDALAGGVDDVLLVDGKDAAASTAIAGELPGRGHALRAGMTQASVSSGTVQARVSSGDRAIGEPT